MLEEDLIAQATTISEKVHDSPKALGFHCKAILVLGLQKCFDFAALALDMWHQHKLDKSPAHYYNGCVMREVRERGLRW